MATLGTVSYGLQLNGVRKFVGGTQSATKGIGALNKGLIALTAATGAVALGMKHLADASGKFSEGLAAVGAVTKATSADMDMLKRAAVQAGIATQFSPKEAVDGLLSLSTAGQTATQAAKTLIPVLNLAAGSLGQLSTAEAGMAIVGTMNTYGMAADKAGEVTDKLLRITQLTNFQTRDFSAGLAKAAAKSNVFGQSLDDTLVVMGLLRNANIDASSAATAYTMAVQRVATDTKALNTLQKLGVSLYDKQTGATRGFMDLITDLKPKMEGLTDATRNKALKDMFGARAIAAYNSIANAQVTVTRDGAQVVLKGADAIEHLRKNVASATGVSKEFTDALLDTYEGQKKLLSGSIATLKVVAGEEFANAFKPMISNAIAGINDLIASLQAMTPEAKRLLVEQTLEWVALAAKIVVATVAIRKLIPLIGSLRSAFIAMAAARAAVEPGRFADAMTLWYSKAGPLVRGLGAITRGLISVKLGAIAAGAALVYAANKSYNSIVAHKERAAMIKRMRTGRSSAEEYQRSRVGRGGTANIGTDIFERRIGATGVNKRIGGTMTAITTKPMELAGKSIEQVQRQLLKLDALQKKMLAARDEGKGFSIFGNITDEAGKVVRVVSITANDIEKRIVKVRKALNALIMSEYEAEAPVTPKLDRATNAALTGAKAAAPTGWTEAEVRAQDARRKFESELADIRDRRQKEHADARLRLQERLQENQDGMWEAIRKRDAEQLRAAKARIQLEKDAAAYAASQEQARRGRISAGVGAIQAGAGGNISGMVQGGMAAMGSALPPMAQAVLTVTDMLAGMTAEGKKFKAGIGAIFQELANTLAPVFQVLNIVLGIVMSVLKPIFDALALWLQSVTWWLMGLVVVLREVWMAFLSFIDWLTLGMTGLSDSISELGAANDTTIRKRKELWDAINGQTKATDAATSATNAATSSMLNLPHGIKIAAKRFAAANVDTGAPRFNDFIQRPGQAATSFSPDDTVIGVKDASGLGGSGTIILQNVHINANDPTSFFRNLLDMVNRDHKRGGQALGGMFQGRP